MGKSFYITASAFVIAVSLAFGFAGCENSSGSGEGRVYIGFAKAGSRTVVPGDAELKTLTIKVSFTGPGGTIDKTFDWQGGTVSLAAGSWQLTASAYSPGRLRAIAGETIQVRPGDNHNIAMTACIGIRSEADLAAALAGGVSGIGHDTASGKGDLLVLESDITLNNAVTVDTVTPFTLISGPGTSRTLTRGSGTLILPAGASLTLGRDGESGGLIIDNAGLPGGMFRKGGALTGSAGFGSLVFGGNTAVVNTVNVLNSPNGWADAINDINNSLGIACVIDIGTNSFDLPASGDPANPNLESGADLTLKGGGTISLSGTGSLFAVTSGAALTLDGPTLQGQDNTDSLVVVEGGGTFAMKEGTIRDNTVTGNGAGVYVAANGNFAMSGGTISENTADINGNPGGGGGVYVDTTGTFTMTGGTISDNTVNTSGAGSLDGGGGVHIASGGTFTMSGGTISGNNSNGTGSVDNNSDGGGGGVYIAGTGNFTMNGGTISGNTATGDGTYNGGGVYIADTGHFTMNGGTISENTANNGGGGVFVYGSPGGSSRGNFTMTAGSISGNSAFAGGGVRLTRGAFTMSGGSITWNTCNNSGGGVFVDVGVFTLALPATRQSVRDNFRAGNVPNNVVNNSGTITINGTVDNTSW